LRSDALPLLTLLAPTAFVIGLLVLGPMLPMDRPWARRLVFAAVWLIVARYFIWRLFSTVVPAQGPWFELAWVRFCFAVEVLGLADTLLLYLTFLRTSDRRAEADAHEARVRATPPESLPSVDVFIPTYNEPFEVLEKTIIAALFLDYPNFRVWVLDDGRRPWLKAFCHEKGAGYITRPDNAHAKAGNINHAVAKTDADFFAVFDADFIPQRNFLSRTMGFFADPRVGIVQVPHAFYNHDPLQVNLALRKTLPDDQRLFFESIMPSRDAWDAAFCCGSNSVTRRAALRTVGDALPTRSITEDILLSLTLLRQGYVTRYLCERLAFGLAPESLKAFFVQRQRWARGAVQILYLAEGPLGPNLAFFKRLLFLPTHWLLHNLMLLMAIVTPLVCMWTGLAPLVNVTTNSVLFYLAPMVLAVTGGIRLYAPRHYFPLAAQVLGTFQSMKVLPTALSTLIRPKGHVFKVTPKGADAQQVSYERGTFWFCSTLMCLTVFGLIINTLPEWRILDQTALLPMVAFWGTVNIVVLFLACMVSLQAPVRRTEERFSIDEPIRVVSSAGHMLEARIKDISLSGVAIASLPASFPAAVGDSARVLIAEVGFIAGTVARRSEHLIAVHFALPPSIERDLLIRKLFTSGFDTAMMTASVWSATLGMLKSIWSVRSRAPATATPAVPAPMLEKLPAESLVLPPRPQTVPLSVLAAQRRSTAA
jgi:cellulose synthase (UDP-forming)